MIRNMAEQGSKVGVEKHIRIVAPMIEPVRKREEVLVPVRRK